MAPRHGGRAFAESDGAGRGSTFTLLLPLRPSRRHDRAMPQRVLIVEDEQHLAEGLRFNLEAEGYDAEVVDTGEAALERLARSGPARFDLVVLDVMLPGKDGFAVVAELRRAQAVRAGPDADRARPAEDVLKGFAAGADDYLPKPTELAILLARIGGLLRRRDWSAASRGRAPAIATRSRSGKTIDFDTLELRVGDRMLPLTLMEANLLRYLIEHEGQGRSPARRCSRRSGACTRTPTRARSTTSSSGCGATSRRSRPIRSTC